MDYNARERSRVLSWQSKADLANESGTFVGARKEARARVDNSVRDQIERVFREVLSPIVKADGGEMYLVRWDGDDVHVHLAGACAGCPGSSLTADSILLPAVRSLAPKARVVVTTGFRIPDGARRV
jgi:Fe-S cluster biogenesis protein NfuA